MARDRDSGVDTRQDRAHPAGDRLRRGEAQVVDDCGGSPSGDRDRQGKIPVPVDVHHIWLQPSEPSERCCQLERRANRMGSTRQGGRDPGHALGDFGPSVLEITPVDEGDVKPMPTSGQPRAVGQLRSLEAASRVEVVGGDQNAHITTPSSTRRPLVAPGTGGRRMESPAFSKDQSCIAARGYRRRLPWPASESEPAAVEFAIRSPVGHVTFRHQSGVRSHDAL